MNEESKLRVFAFPFLALGAILCVLAVVVFLSELTTFGEGKVVRGTVVRIEQAENMPVADPSWPFHPAYSVVQFTDTKGQLHEIRSSAAADPPLYALGDHPAVTYDVKNPTKYAKLPGDPAFVGAVFLGVATNLCFMIGACLLAAGDVIERFRARRAAKPKTAPPAVLVS